MATRCFLPSLVLFLCLVTVQSVIYQLKGQQVQFDPDITGQPKRILWKHNGDKVMEFNGNKEQVYGFYEGRVTLDWHSAKLQISDLCIEDSGEYEYEIYMEKFVHRKTYELKVMEKIAKPNITCQMNSSSSSVSAVLLCSVELSQPQSSLMFRWISKGNVQHGPQLTIFLGGKLDEEQYTCRVSNPVSYETATFRAKDCHTGSSRVRIAPIVIIFIVIIGVGLAILLYRYRDKVSACRKKGQKTDLENPTSSEEKKDNEADTQPFDSPKERGSKAAQGEQDPLQEGEAEEHEAEAKAKSDFYKPSQEEEEEEEEKEKEKKKKKSLESNHSDEDVQSSITSERSCSETTRGGQEPNLLQKEPHESDDNQQEKTSSVVNHKHADTKC